MAQLFSTLELPSEYLHAFLDVILVDVLERASVPSHLRALVADSYRGSWITTNGRATATMTSAGSRPGEPLADLIFNFITAAIFHDLDLQLRAQGLVDVIEYQKLDGAALTPFSVQAYASTAAMTSPDVSFVDDGVIHEP